MKLAVPLICECGFNTMEAKEALDHIRKHHPEMLSEADLQREKLLDRMSNCPLVEEI